MQPSALIQTLAQAGVSLELSVRAKGDLADDTRTLIRDNRDALLEHLVNELCGRLNVSAPKHLEDAGTLHLYGDLLLNLMGWAAQHQELRLERPGAVVLNARPEHVRNAVKAHPWGVVYDCESRVLVSWGDVPTSALLDKRDLMTDEPFAAEAVAA